MIYLASKSPRRKQLLEQLGQAFEIVNIDIEEVWDGIENPEDYVTRLALEKALAGRTLLDNAAPVLGADTEVIIDDLILGKPSNKEEAVTMLERLSGRTHYVYSAVALSHNQDYVELNTNRITFRTLNKKECENYCNTDEPFDKAGAYAIQGKAAAFVTRLEGSFSGVMGLPLAETAKLLKKL